MIMTAQTMTPTERAAALIEHLRAHRAEADAAYAAAPDDVIVKCRAESARHSEWYVLFGLLGRTGGLLNPGGAIDSVAIATRCDELHAELLADSIGGDR